MHKNNNVLPSLRQSAKDHGIFRRGDAGWQSKDGLVPKILNQMMHRLLPSAALLLFAIGWAQAFLTVEIRRPIATTTTTLKVGSLERANGILASEAWIGHNETNVENELSMREWEDPLRMEGPSVSVERYRAISLHSLDQLAEKHPEILPHLEDIRLAGLIFPFKTSPYFVDELIDWSLGSARIHEDPLYRLVFPTLDMLCHSDRQKLVNAKASKDPLLLTQVVDEIRRDLNPHPGGQTTLNLPNEPWLKGVQHKYSETVLVFPAAGQTCHSYCTYCFRWAQFIGDDELRFSQKEARSLLDYLADHEEVSDILLTGGDPMIMRTSSLKEYLEPFCDPSVLPHVRNLRIGTRSLTFWPRRFVSDPDADDLLELLRRVRESGGRHVAIMAHLGHARELSTPIVKTAIANLQTKACVTIRSQAPIMKGINDCPDVWAEKWKTEVSMGIIPYYMFVARDTGAREYFEVPLAKAHSIYSDAISGCSGLIRTVRGPSMSCTPGKIEVTGIEEVLGQTVFVLRFLQCRDPHWIGRPFFAKYNANAVWFDDLEALDGMDLPWDEHGILKPVPPRAKGTNIEHE